MLQFMTDFQLKTILNVTPFRPAGSDVQSLLNPPPTHVNHKWGDKPNECELIPYYLYFDSGRTGGGQRMTTNDIYNLDQWYVGDVWDTIWTNLHAMRETGIREISKCIEVDRHLLIALDFSDFNRGKGKCEFELITKLYPRGWICRRYRDIPRRR